MDKYWNFHLEETEEFTDDVSQGKLGSVLIRCNNVLWIRFAPIDQLPKENKIEDMLPKHEIDRQQRLLGADSKSEQRDSKMANQPE